MNYNDKGIQMKQFNDLYVPEVELPIEDLQKQYCQMAVKELCPKTINENGLHKRDCMNCIYHAYNIEHFKILLWQPNNDGNR